MITTAYIPDSWIIMKTPDCFKVLASWRGGYLHGDEWRLSSGVTRVEDKDDSFVFHNFSGSKYVCFKHREHLTMVMHSIYDDLISAGSTHIHDLSVMSYLFENDSNESTDRIVARTM